MRREKIVFAETQSRMGVVGWSNRRGGLVRSRLTTERLIGVRTYRSNDVSIQNSLSLSRVGIVSGYAWVACAPCTTVNVLLFLLGRFKNLQGRGQSASWSNYLVMVG
jgi:hypothetical protein